MTAAAGLWMLAAVAVLLIATGLPAWIVLIGVALAFACAGLATGTFGLAILTAVPGRLVGLLDNDLLQALPLYVLMGALLHRLPLADTLFRAGRRALRATDAGAPLAGLGLGALLAPMNGSVGASVAMLGRTVLPQLRASGIPEAKSAALVCVASTLGVVVPPSLVLILLADAMMRAHTEAVNATGAATRIVNTQDIFVGALGPAALVLAAVATIAWLGDRQRVATDVQAPPLPRRTWITAIVTAGLVGALLGAVTLGYLYAVEAAATGGVALVAWGLGTRTLDRAVLRDVLADTIAVTGALFALLVGATTFTLVLRSFETDRWIAALLAALPGGAPSTLALVLACLALCALVLDAFELIFVVVPIVMPPLLMQVDDAAWVAVLALLILQLGFLLPPLGYAVLIIRRHVADGTGTRALARALAPYVVAIAGVLALTLAVPSLVQHRGSPPAVDTVAPAAGSGSEDEASVPEPAAFPDDNAASSSGAPEAAPPAPTPARASPALPASH